MRNEENRGEKIIKTIKQFLFLIRNLPFIILVMILEFSFPMNYMDLIEMIILDTEVRV